MEVNLYLSSRYDVTSDVGALGYYIKGDFYESRFNESYYRTTGPRMEMVACILGLTEIRKKLSPGTKVFIHSNQTHFMGRFISGHSFKRSSHSFGNEDLIQRLMFAKAPLILILKEADIKDLGFHIAKAESQKAYQKPPTKEDMPDINPPKAKPLF